MIYIVESSKSFYEVGLDLPPVIQRLGFVVLHVDDFCNRPGRKETGLDDECQVFTLENARLSEQLLAIDMKFSLILPWRIVLLTDNGATKIGLLSPQAMLGALKQDKAASRIIAEIEQKLIQIVDEAR